MAVIGVIGGLLGTSKVPEFLDALFDASDFIFSSLFHFKKFFFSF